MISFCGSGIWMYVAWVVLEWGFSGSCSQTGAGGGCWDSSVPLRGLIVSFMCDFHGD